MSSPGLAFAKSIKQELEDNLEVYIVESIFLTFGTACGKTNRWFSVDRIVFSA